MAQAKYTRAPTQIQGNTVSRRRLLAAIPAVAVLLAMAGVPALAATETPVTQMFRHWLILDEEERRAYEEGRSDEEQEAATDRKLAVELQMREAPKHQLIDVALALFASSDCGAFNVDTEVRLKFRAQALALMAA